MVVEVAEVVLMIFVITVDWDVALTG